MSQKKYVPRREMRALSARATGFAATTGIFCLLALSACGGSGPGDDFDNAMSCIFANCKDSDTLKVADISALYTVSQSGGNVRVDAQLGQSANLLTRLRLTSQDRLSATVGNQRAELTATDSTQLFYAANFSNGTAQPSASVEFQRGADSYTSTVTMPAAFSVVAPTGTSLLARSSGKLLVHLSLPVSVQATASANLIDCVRVDNSHFSAQAVPVASSWDDPAAPNGRYRIDTLALDKTLNERSANANNNNASTALVASCELELVWTYRLNGTISPGMNQHGYISALRTASHKIVYNSRL